MGIADSRITGIRGTGFNALNLHGGSASDALLDASMQLVEKGAGAIVLGCAGMAPMTASMEQAIRAKAGRHIPVIDGVQAAIELGIGFGRMKLRTMSSH